jgi:microsomal epoxide hydrolase
MGYSLFPEELAPIPVSVVKKVSRDLHPRWRCHMLMPSGLQTGNLIWHREHTSGGHFAAMEKSKLFVKDMEDFIAAAWTKPKM